MSSERQPLDREPEVGGRDALGSEQVHVEVDGLLKVARVDADVVDLRAHYRRHGSLTRSRGASAARRHRSRRDAAV